MLTVEATEVKPIIILEPIVVTPDINNIYDRYRESGGILTYYNFSDTLSYLHETFSSFEKLDEELRAIPTSDRFQFKHQLSQFENREVSETKGPLDRHEIELSLFGPLIIYAYLHREAGRSYGLYPLGKAVTFMDGEVFEDAVRITRSYSSACNH